MARGKRIGLAGGILASLFLVTLSIAAQDIQVPAEFLFGRWAQGHYVILDRTIAEEPDSYWRNTYTYTSGSLRATIAPLGNFILWNQEDGAERSAPLDLYWRPSSRMQLGIEDVGWWSLYSDVSSATWASTGKETTYFMRPRFDFTNTDSFSVSPEYARYWYLVDEFLIPGQLLCRTTGVLRKDEEHSDYRRHESPDADDRYNRFERDHRALVLGSSLAYGLWRDVAVKARVQMTAHWSEQTRIDVQVIDAARHSYMRLGEDQSTDWSYTLEALTRPLPSVYLSFGADQAFSDWGWSAIQEAAINDSLVGADTSDYPHPFHLDSSKFFARTHLITDGEFNPTIILDDYQNFYGHQLFAGQTHLSAEFAFMRAPRRGTRWSHLALLAEHAVSRHLQMGLSADYNYQLYFTGASEHRLSSSLSVQYRSYDYNSAMGPGWHRDSQFDIAFGALPRFGQWLAALQARVADGESYSSPESSSDDVISVDHDKPFDLRLDYWQLTHTLGLGRGIAVNSSHQILLRGSEMAKWHIAFHAYSIGLRARPAKMIELSGSFNYAFTHYPHNYSYLQNRIWNLQLQVLL